MHDEHLIVISADTHAGAAPSQYRDYLASRWHDEFDAWLPNYSTDWQDLLTEDASRNWDSVRRQDELDADGIAAELILPNTIPPFFPEPHLAGTLPGTDEEYQRRWAGLQAHNRWVHDFCAEVPDRRRGVIQVLPNNVDDAVAEIEWAAQQPNLCGVLLPSVPPNTIDPLYVARYDPIWKACLEGDLPVVTHAGGGAPTLPADPASMPILIYEYGFWSHRTLWHLILGGVFERFEGLRYVATEQGGPSWFSRLAAALDTKFSMLTDPKKQTIAFDPSGLAAMSLLPSEYMRRNCWVTASFCQPHEIPYRHDVGIDRIMWGTDYPHTEGTTPHSREALRATFAGLPDDEIRAILSENAAQVFGFDLDALRPFADAVGPTLADIHEPLTAVPPDSTSYAFLPEYQATY